MCVGVEDEVSQAVEVYERSLSGGVVKGEGGPVEVGVEAEDERQTHLGSHVCVFVHGWHGCCYVFTCYSEDEG